MARACMCCDCIVPMVLGLVLEEKVDVAAPKCLSFLLDWSVCSEGTLANGLLGPDPLLRCCWASL